MAFPLRRVADEGRRDIPAPGPRTRQGPGRGPSPAASGPPAQAGCPAHVYGATRGVARCEPGPGYAGRRVLLPHGMGIPGGRHRCVSWNGPAHSQRAAGPRNRHPARSRLPGRDQLRDRGRDLPRRVRGGCARRHQLRPNRPHLRGPVDAGPSPRWSPPHHATRWWRFSRPLPPCR